jgi:ABC-type sugar transport system permease subunit
MMLHRSRLYLTLLLLMLPTLAGVLVFIYYPSFAAFKYSLYNWDGQSIVEYRGLANFIEAFTGDALFWQSFRLIFILLLANVVKMWPCVFTAIVLHRIRSEKWQYVYRVLFVVPMVIPAVVNLLLWKTFYEPMYGPLNALLRATGMMRLLDGMDTGMPKLAAMLMPARRLLVDIPFGSVWGLALVGVMLMLARRGRGALARLWFPWLLALLIAGGIWLVIDRQPLHLLWWPAMLLVALFIGGGPIDLRRKIARVVGVCMIILSILFMLLTMIWTAPTGEFAEGTPAWLGRTELIVPAIVFWGFPWVGTIGVLIYLAGLQNIPADVYEAAELDGVGPIRKLTSIELPLVMTQVRINLIFMTIGTLADYGLFLLLLGPNGGPGGVGMVPGLYAYRAAFMDGRFGYACALGIVMFVVTLAVTMLYQKYVKVEK